MINPNSYHLQYNSSYYFQIKKPFYFGVKILFSNILLLEKQNPHVSLLNTPTFFFTMRFLPHG